MIHTMFPYNMLGQPYQVQQPQITPFAQQAWYQQMMPAQQPTQGPRWGSTYVPQNTGGWTGGTGNINTMLRAHSGEPWNPELGGIPIRHRVGLD